MILTRNGPTYSCGRLLKITCQVFLKNCLTMQVLLSKTCTQSVKRCRPEHAPHRFKHIPVSPYRVDEPVNDQQIGQHYDKRKHRRIKLIPSEQEQDRNTYKQGISSERDPTEDRMPFAQHGASRRRRQQEDQITVDHDAKVGEGPLQNSLDQFLAVPRQPLFNRTADVRLFALPEKLSRLRPLRLQLSHVGEGPPEISGEDRVVAEHESDMFVCIRLRATLGMETVPRLPGKPHHNRNKGDDQ